MPAVQSDPRFDAIACKWHDLAERRLEYFTELYRSGRWQHYYTRERFALLISDVVKATKIWRELAGGRRAEQPVARRDEMRPAA